MANRTVSVELTLKAEQYKAEAEAAKVKTEELDRKVEALDKDINKLPADSVKAAAGLDILDAAAKKTGDDIDTLGKKTEETSKKTSVSADESGKLKARIEELKGSVSKLGAEFDKTGDPALLKKFRSDSAELAGLTKMARGVDLLGSNLEQLGIKAEKSAFAMSDLIGPAIALGAGPALAAGGGLALGGIGVAGAGLGIAGAVLGNPETFKAAWGAATGEVKKDLIDAGAAFTGPALQAIRSIGPLIDGWHLDKALAPAAKFVPEIATGIEGALTGLEHGFADALGKAGPDVQALSDGLMQLGQAGGDAMSHIADGAEGGAQALHDVIQATTAIILGFGLIVEAAEKTYSWIQDHPIQAALMTGGISIGASIWANALGNVNTAGKSVIKTMDGVTLTGNLAADAAKKQADEFAGLAKKLTETKLDADSLAESMSLKILNTTMSLDQATLHFDESLTKVGESLKANGKILDWHSAKGQANVSAILASVQANISAYKANVDAGMGAEQAASAYDANTAALERQLRKSGLTQASIDGLIGKYRGVPKKVDTDIAINGLTDAINSLSDLIAQINGIAGHNFHSTVTVDYIANTQSLYHNQVPNFSSTPTPPSAPNSPHNGPHPHAAGGMLDPGWNLLGEQGPELEHNGWVYTASQTRSMMAASQTWGGGSSAVAVSLDVSSAANTTWLGGIINEGLRNGYIVVKASQVRQNV